MFNAPMVGNQGLAYGPAWGLARREAARRRSLAAGAGSLLVAVLVPAAMAANGILLSQQEPEAVASTAFLCAVSLFLSLATGRRLLTYVRVDAVAYLAATTAAISWGLAGVCKVLHVPLLYGQFFAASIVFCVLVGVLQGFRIQVERRVLAALPGALRSLDDLGSDVEILQLVSPPTDASPFDGFVADLRANMPKHWESFLADVSLQGYPVYHVKELTEALTGRVKLDHLSENTFGALLPALVYPDLKHAIDRIAALLLLPLVLPVLAIASAGIRLSGPGPVLFRQKRTGQGGRPFTVLKLRTMVDGADRLGPRFTDDGDVRITPLGRVLRKYRIDELPQIFNVLRGEMSWIGPRPEAIELASWYEREIAFYRYRHVVRPGITGWAQVQHGNVGAVDAARRKLEYDFYYIKHFSFWLDVVIAVRTVHTILTGFGAR